MLIEGQALHCVAFLFMASGFSDCASEVPSWQDHEPVPNFQIRAKSMSESTTAVDEYAQGVSNGAAGDLGEAPAAKKVDFHMPCHKTLSARNTAWHDSFTA